MKHATAGDAPYRVPRESKGWPALLMALAMHAILLFFLWAGVQWQNTEPVAVEAEVWDMKVQDAAPLAPPPAAQAEPEPEAAPAPPPPPTPTVAVAPPPAPAVPVAAPPAPKVPDIALEQLQAKRRIAQEKQEQQEQLQQEKRKEQEKAAKLAKARAEAEAKSKALAEAKAAADAKAKALAKAAADAKAKAAADAKALAKNDAAAKADAKAKAEQKLADQQAKAKRAATAAAEQKASDEAYQANMRRLTGTLAGTGTGGAGNAARSTSPKVDSGYTSAIRIKILGNIAYNAGADVSGNPQAEFKIEQLPNGEINSVRKTKSSGIAAYDSAVENAIAKSSPLPKKKDGTVERELVLVFKMKDRQ